jgi:hypothetical protein
MLDNTALYAFVSLELHQLLDGLSTPLDIDTNWQVVNNTFYNSSLVFNHPHVSNSLVRHNKFYGNRCTYQEEQDSLLAAFCPALVSGVENTRVEART